MNPDVSSLSDEARQRGLHALLICTFLMVIGFTMVIPLVAVHFVDTVGMAAATVGLALAARQFTQQGLAVVGGVLADRIGSRPMLCLGVLVRAVGFASLAFSTSLVELFIAMMISALGGALFETPYQASIAALTTDQERPRYYSINQVVSGVATTLGPLVGVALLRFDFGVVCLAAAACFALNASIALRVPSTRANTGGRLMWCRGLQLVMRDRSFLCLTVLLMGYWFTMIQISISFPLMAYDLTRSQADVGIMFALASGLNLALQYPLVRTLERRFTPAQILVAGVVIMACGAGSIAFVQTFPPFLICVGIYSLGQLLTRPTQQTVVAAMAHPDALGTFLGFSSLGLAVGGGVGNLAGGWLIDGVHAGGWSALPWAVFCVIGLLSALGLFVLTAPRHHGWLAARASTNL